MSTQAERRSPAPPTQSTTPGSGVTILATAVTAAALAVPEGWYAKELTLAVNADGVWVAFGAAATPAIDKTFAGGASVAAGTKAENAVLIPAAGRLSVRLDRNIHKYIHFQAVANTPTLTVYPSSQGRLRAG